MLLSVRAYSYTSRRALRFGTTSPWRDRVIKSSTSAEVAHKVRTHETCVTAVQITIGEQMEFLRSKMSIEQSWTENQHFANQRHTLDYIER